MNGATCTDTGIPGIPKGSLGYKCSCALGWKGNNCKLDVDDCLVAPCKNGGTCADAGTNAYLCTCAKGFRGFKCQNVIAPPPPAGSAIKMSTIKSNMGMSGTATSEQAAAALAKTAGVDAEGVTVTKITANVEVKLTLGITAAELTAGAKSAFTVAFAKSIGVDAKDVKIKGTSGGTRRRLLAAALVVDLQLAAVTPAQAKGAKAKLGAKDFASTLAMGIEKTAKAQGATFSPKVGSVSKPTVKTSVLFTMVVPKSYANKALASLDPKTNKDLGTQLAASLQMEGVRDAKPVVTQDDSTITSTTSTAVWRGTPEQLAAIRDKAAARKAAAAGGDQDALVYGLITLMVLLCICCTSVGGFVYMKFQKMLPEGMVPEKGQMFVPTIGVKIVDMPGSKKAKDNKKADRAAGGDDNFTGLDDVEARE